MRRFALAALTALGLASLFVMVVATLLAVATRFLGLTGLEGSYEVAGIAFVWTTFLGAALAEARRENAAFEVLRSALPPHWQTGLERLGALLLLAVGATLVSSGVAALARTGLVPTPLLRWPGGLQVAAAPVLGVCLVLLALPRIVKGRPHKAALPTILPAEGAGTPL